MYLLSHFSLNCWFYIFLENHFRFLLVTLAYYVMEDS